MVVKPYRFLILQLLFHLALPLVSAIEINVASQWKNFKREFDKSYSSIEEEEKRFAIFEENIRFISKHNLEADLGLHSYWVGLNHFSDLSHEELKNTLKCLKIKNKPATSKFDLSPETTADIDIDYRKKGMVTEVKNQEYCGACYAFATTGSIEGMWAKIHGKLISMSEQEIVDCSSNEGCNGGDFPDSYKAVEKMGGLDSETSYPYQAKRDKCRFKKDAVVANISSFKQVPHDEKALLKSLVSHGPHACGINGMLQTFFSYKTGVYDDPKCSEKELNHAVTLVGFSTVGKTPHWIIKNEWSTQWGEAGYMRLAANKHMCGIDSYCYFPAG